MDTLVITANNWFLPINWVFLPSTSQLSFTSSTNQLGFLAINQPTGIFFISETNQLFPPTKQLHLLYEAQYLLSRYSVFWDIFDKGSSKNTFVDVVSSTPQLRAQWSPNEIR